MWARMGIPGFHALALWRTAGMERVTVQTWLLLLPSIWEQVSSALPLSTSSPQKTKKKETRLKLWIYKYLHVLSLMHKGSKVLILKWILLSDKLKDLFIVVSHVTLDNQCSTSSLILRTCLSQKKWLPSFIWDCAFGISPLGLYCAQCFKKLLRLALRQGSKF